MKKEIYEKAIILDSRFTGANLALITVFTESHGLQKGIVKIAKKKQAEIQKGNLIEYVHYKRTNEHLGVFKINIISQIFIRYFDDFKAINCMNQILGTLCKYLKPEIPHKKLFDLSLEFLENINTEAFQTDFLLFEYHLLSDLGFSIDMKKHLSVDDNDKSAPFYISPKTGAVVSKNLGEKYHDKLMVIPEIFGGQEKDNQINLAKRINNFLKEKMYS